MQKKWWFRLLMVLPLLPVLAVMVMMWAPWRGEGPALLPPDARADFVLIEKAARRLTLLREDKPLKSYDIALGGAPLGPKQQEGDSKTPEGRYVLDWRNPNSKFHLSLHISYPTADQHAAAKAQGRSAGGDIMIHGQPNSTKLAAGLLEKLPGDWTDGCIAVSNAEMEEIWRTVPNGTPIEIRP